MNQTQLQQETENTLPCISSDASHSETGLLEEETNAEQDVAVEKLLAALEHNTRKRQKWNSIVAAIYGISLLCFVLVLILGWISGHRWVHANDYNFINVIHAFGYLTGAFLLDKKAATELTKLNDVRGIGALVDIWNPQGSIPYRRNIRMQAETALIRVLPRLKASDAPVLKEHQRAALRGVLSSDGCKNWGRYHDEAFMLAILQGLAHIGDWKSASIVRRLIISAKHAKVRAAAQDCLPYLEEIAEKQKAGETLLRASSASDSFSVAPDMLLRPATSGRDTQLQTLLHPVE